MKLLNRWVVTATIAAMLLAVAVPVRAQDASLALVPAKAPIVVQVNGFEKARDRLGKFLGNALPDIAPRLAKQMDDGLKEALDGRDLKSVSKGERIYFAVMDLASLSNEPELALLIPVASYKEFVDSFLKDDEKKSLKKDADGFDSVKLENQDEPFYLVDRKNYVVGTNNKDVAKSFAKGDDAGLAKAMSPETAKAFLSQDVSVYVNLKMVNKQFGAQIRGFKALIDLGLQGGGMGIDKKQIELIKNLFNSFLSLLDDGTAAVLGLDFRPEGANLHLSAQFGSDTETNNFLKKLKPTTLQTVGTLPGGLLMYTASNFDPTQSKTLAALMQDALADDEDEDAKKGIQNALKEMSENGRVIEVAALKNFSSGLEVAEYKDGAKAVASTLKLFKSLSKTGSFGNLPLKDKPEIKENAESVGDIKFNLVRFSFDFDKAVEKLPEDAREAAKATMIKVADERTNVWFGNAGNKVFQVSGKDWADAKAVVEDYLKGTNALDKDESFATTRKQLPTDATILVLADSARFIEMAMDLVRESAAGVPGFPGGGIPSLKAPKGKPAYFGMAIVLKSENASFDLFVPVTAVQQVRKMFAPLIDGDN